MPPGALSRGELIALLERIVCGKEQEADEVRVVALFAESRAPGCVGLIFYPDSYFGAGQEPSAEEIVDKALAYR